MAKKKQQSNWIKVEERLPEPHKTVIFSTCGAVYAGEFCGGSMWLDHQRRMLISTTTHWQPLPDLPEE